MKISLITSIIFRPNSINIKRIDHLYENKNLILKYRDLTDRTNLLQIYYQIKNTYNNK